MTLASAAPPGALDRLSSRLILFWAGLSVGVAFLATPAKFLAPSLSLPVALDVGRQTFNLYNHVELGLLAGLVLLAIGSRRPGARALALGAPAAIIVLQALWLIPVLDGRVAAILAGDNLPASDLHVLYIGLEMLKVLWLLSFGLVDLLPRRDTALGGTLAPRRLATARSTKARWKD